jgi:hypothetical protein
LVFLLDQYFQHLPKYVFERDILYLHPKARVLSCSDEPWYDIFPVGKNKLSTIVKDNYVW